MNLRVVKLALLIALEFLRRNWVWIVGGLTLILILVISLYKLNLFYADTLRIGLIGTYQEHDLPEEVTKLISSGLVKADSNSRIKPNLVSGWEVNHDATQFKFKLKDNLKWADETLVKAEDLDLRIPNTTLTFPDERTIQFNLKEPFSPLPSILTKPLLKKGSLTGVGPYQITRLEKSRIFITKITLESSDPKLPDLKLRFYPNEKVAATGYSLGEVQVLSGVSDTGLFSSNPLTGVLQKVDYSKIVTILFQTRDPLFTNRSLRQALSYQTPKIEGTEIANNPYPPNFWAYDKDSKKYLSNPKEAEEALERAKLQLPNDKFNSELILTTTPNLEEAGKVIVKSWKDLGFDAKLRVESGIPQNFQALLITQSIPVDPDQYFLWHATQTKTNLTKYDSKRVDKDLEDGREIITEEERKAKYFDFQKTLLEDAPAVFLYFPKYNIIYLKKVEPLLDMVMSLVI